MYSRNSSSFGNEKFLTLRRQQNESRSDFFRFRLPCRQSTVVIIAGFCAKFGATQRLDKKICVVKKLATPGFALFQLFAVLQRLRETSVNAKSLPSLIVSLLGIAGYG